MSTTSKIVGGLLCLAVGAGAGTYAGVKVAQHKESTIQTETNQASEDRGYEQGYLDAIAEKEEDIATLESAIETLETEKTELEEQIDTLEAALENATTQEEYDALEEQLTAAQTSLATAQAQVTSLQSQISTLQGQVAALQAQLETASQSAGLDLSQLTNATMVKKLNQENTFYLFKEGSQGLFKVSVDINECIRLIPTGTSYSVITTEDPYDFAVVDDSLIYSIDEYGNASLIQLQEDVGQVLNYIAIGKGRAFVSVISEQDDMSILVLDTYNGEVVDTIDFASEDMHYFMDDVRVELYIISDDGDKCLSYCINENSQDFDQYTTINITAGNELDDIYYDSVIYVTNFIFVRGNNDGGLWRIDWANHIVVKVSDDSDFQYYGDVEDNGVFYAILEGENEGVRVNTEDGTYTTYTPEVEASTLTDATYWEAPGLTIAFDSNGNYTITDADSKYFDAGDLTGTYTISGYNIMLTGGNGGDFVMRYNRDGFILYEDEYAGEGLMEFWPV